MQDKELIIRYLKGDENAIEALISKHLKHVYNFVYRRIGNIAESEDITQEIFVKVWKNIKNFDLNKNFKPWLFTIAKNALIDFFRKKKAIPFSSFDDENGQNAFLNRLASSVVSVEERLDNEKLMGRAIDSLSSKHRTVFSYRHRNEMTFIEISQILGESINTVKSRYRRALEIVRRALR